MCVLLVSMPYGSLERPALGISLLKPLLDERRIPCDIHYLTFPFADLIGVDEYNWISCELPYTAFAGDWTFTESLYGPDPLRDRAYVDEILCGVWQQDNRSVARVLRIRSLTHYFLNYCLAAIDWQKYAIVGFTSTFEQNLASLALARLVKEAYPKISIVFGGANWEGEMGAELHRQFPFVDLVCSGEADESFPALAERIVSGAKRSHSLRSIRGIVYRARNESVSTGQADVVRELDRLPYPDFSAYFQGLDQSCASSVTAPTVLFETSRGCWWGAKSHCTFCGLNGGTMAFRSKSAERALRELDYLIDSWPVDTVEVVDNILDMKYFRDFLPALAEHPRSAALFYEVKANLSRDQVRLLHAAGVTRIQPGIESLSNHVLQLMRKGTTALQNIQLLKWCKEFDMQVDWNILYGFPGECRSDYSAIQSLLPAIRFLPPPGACAPLRLDRFSPYFSDPGAFGLCNVRPLAPYRYLYPVGSQLLAKIAYYFDFDYRTDTDPTGFAATVVQEVTEWQQASDNGSLTRIAVDENEALLVDTRCERIVPQRSLVGLEKEAYDYCDERRSLTAVIRHLTISFPGVDVNEDRVAALLQTFVSDRLMVSDGDQYLSLAIGCPPALYAIKPGQLVAAAR